MWTQVVTPPRLAPDEVHVWCVRLDGPGNDPDHLAACRNLLSEAETQRAQRLAFDEPREHFIVARAALRLLLAGYLDVAATELEFVYGKRGKPQLKYPQTDTTFNLSHSGQHMLLAVASHRHVGVDVERTQRTVNWQAVARRFFAPREQAAMAALPDDRQRQAFFRCWTRKEAFMKATGLGLAYGLSRFAVSLTSDAEIQWLHEGNPADWGLMDVNPDAEYAGAVCARGRDWRVVPLTITNGELLPR